MPEATVWQEEFSSLVEDEENELVKLHLAEEEPMLNGHEDKSNDIRARWEDWQVRSTHKLYNDWQGLSQSNIIQVSGLILLTVFLAWLIRGQYDTITDSHSSSSSLSSERHAFVTFLNPYTGNPAEEDIYYTNVRMLIYETLHAPETRMTHPNIDFVVATVPGVFRIQWDRLVMDGAVIPEVAIDPEMAPTHPRWKFQMSKLEVLKFTEYDKIVFLDADTLIMKPMEDVFVDAGAVVVKTLNVTTTDLMLQEPELPKDYLFASVDDLMGHGYDKRKHDAWSRYRYFNGGFWMARPSVAMYNYTKGLTSLAEGRFSTGFNEQNLLNYATRKDGPMPWTELERKWNIWAPNEKEWDMNMVSYHSHMWTYGGRRALAWGKIRFEMEEFHAARENTKVPELWDNGLLKS